MTGREVGALASATSSVASILQQLGNNYYASSAAWKEFPSQVKLLQERHSALAAKLEKYGQDVGPALVEAEKLMLKEVETLKKRRSRERETSGGRKLRGVASFVSKRMTETLFPEKIALAVGDAIRAYDRIGEHLRLEVETEKNIRFLASNCPIPLPFCDDDLYVSLERTESSISSALNQSEREVIARPIVVLLYGGPGTGKSTVSRHISLKYRSDSASVVWLECGPSQDPISAGLKLLQHLGWSDDLTEIPGQIPNNLLWKGSIRSRLKNLFRTRELLIVLDDLHDPQLLQDLLTLSEPNVKYIVTSQRDDICDNLSGSFTVKIQIENLGVDEPGNKNISKKLLAVHSGCESGNIPSHLQEIAEKIADQADGNPLVIATLGAQLKNADHRDNPAVWKCLLDSPSQFLDEGVPSQSIHGVPHPKSYWSVLSHSVSSLGDGEKQMLLLLCHCKDASVPDGVVFFLLSSICTTRRSDMLHFLTITKRLKSRQLLSSKTQHYLQVHSLTRTFIREKMKELAKRLADAIAESIVNKNSLTQQAASSSSSVTKATMSRVLVRFYLDENLVLDMLSVIADHMSQPHATFSDAKKTAIEPIMLKLLALDANWTEEIHQAATQVFLDFVYNDFLCNAHLALLLWCPTWTTPTLKFLQSASALGESFWKKSTMHGLHSTFEKILAAEHHPEIQIQGVDTLQKLVYHEANCKHILNAADMLLQLVNLMCQSQNSAVQSCCTEFFVSFLRSATKNFFITLLAQQLLTPRLNHILPGLLNLLANDHNAHLQRQAAIVLRDFLVGCHLQSRRQILSNSTLLSTLATSLSSQLDPILQCSLMQVIASLAEGDADQTIKQQIANYPGLLDNLEMRLDEPGDPQYHVQFSAARALLTMHWTKYKTKCLPILTLSLKMEHDPDLQIEAIQGLHSGVSGSLHDVSKDEMSGFPGLLETLGKSLDNNASCGLQYHIVALLAHLSNSKLTCVRARMLSSPLLLERVVTVLSKCQDASARRYALWTLDNVSQGLDQALRDQFVKLPGLLTVLKNILDQPDDPQLCVSAASTLVNLTPTKDTTKLLKILTLSLEPDHNYHVRTTAASGIRDLARVGDHLVREEALRFPGLLNNLVESLDPCIEGASVQKYAANAVLELLASQDKFAKLKLMQTPLLLERVVALVRNIESPELQSSAISIIVILGSVDAEIRQIEIMESVSWMGELEKLLSHENTLVRAKVATALVNLQQQLDGVSQAQPARTSTFRQLVARLVSYQDILRISFLIICIFQLMT